MCDFKEHRRETCGLWQEDYSLGMRDSLYKALFSLFYWMSMIEIIVSMLRMQRKFGRGVISLDVWGNDRS